MNKYIVTVIEQVESRILVEASSEDDAIDMAAEGNGEWLDILQNAECMDSSLWKVELESEGE